MEIASDVQDRSSEHSINFVDWLFTHVSGRAHVPVNGEIAGYDRQRGVVFVRGMRHDIPATEFLSCLSANEVDKLRRLPDWNGGNEAELSGALLSATQNAIRRYHSQPPVAQPSVSDLGEPTEESCRYFTLHRIPRWNAIDPKTTLPYSEY